MRIAELNTTWLASAVGVEPARVAGLDAAAVGTGQVADTYRLRFRLDGEPRSLVLKVTPDNPVSRQTGQGQASYLREVRFYQELAATLAVRVPRWRGADADDAGAEFHLLLEDMTPCRPGDQLAGCTLAEAEAVLEQAVGLHAPRWQDPALHRLPWLKVNAANRRPGADVYTALFAAFRQRYADRIEDELLAVGAALFPHIDTYYQAQRAAPQTVTHGDLRPDNLLFAGHDGQVPVTVVDWQTVDVGPGIADVSYFIGGALPTEARQAHERRLVERYHEGLRRRGVDGYSLADCWLDYARFSLAGYIMGVGASMSVRQTERGDLMFISMVRSAGRHALDLDALGLLGLRSPR